MITLAFMSFMVFFILHGLLETFLTFLLLQGNSLKHIADDMSGPLSPIPVPAQKQLKYTAGIANGSDRESAVFIDQARKVRLLFPLPWCC